MQKKNPNANIRKQINELNEAIKHDIKQVKRSIDKKCKENIIKQGPRHPLLQQSIKATLNPNRSSTTPIKYNDKIVTDTQTKTEIFASYFKHIFTNTDSVFDDTVYKQRITSQYPNLSPL